MFPNYLAPVGEKENLVLGCAIKRSKRRRLCAFKKCAKELFSPSASVVSLVKVRLEGSQALVPI